MAGSRVSTGWLRIRLFDYCRACFVSGTAGSDRHSGKIADRSSGTSFATSITLLIFCNTQRKAQPWLRKSVLEKKTSYADPEHQHEGKPPHPGVAQPCEKSIPEPDSQ